jgi:iron complex outermembrane receptor protein
MSYAGFDGYFKFGYNYSPSVFKGTDPGTTELLNKQLIYVPFHKLQETFFVEKHNYFAMISYTFTGKRYVQPDNMSSLPAFALLDFFGGTTLKILKLKFRVQFEIRNVFNKSYQSVLYYPEPGRYYSLSLLIH